MPMYRGGEGWPSVLQQVVEAHLARAADGADGPRLEAILFAPRGERVTEAEVIPRLNQLHYESGSVIDLYFPGYYRRDAKQTDVSDSPSEVLLEVADIRYVWVPESFVQMEQEAAHAFPAWRSRGECDLLLVVSRAVTSDADYRIPFELTDVFEPATAYQVWLTQAMDDGAIPSVHSFLVGLIDYAEHHTDPRGFMLQTAGKAGFRAFFEWVLSALPGDVQPLWKKTRYLAPAFQLDAG